MVGGEENEAVLVLDVGDKAIVGVEKPPDELSINGEQFLAD
jgi:hypothetical protein